MLLRTLQERLDKRKGRWRDEKIAAVKCGQIMQSRRIMVRENCW